MNKHRYEIIKITDYWRVLKDRILIGTYYSRETARAAIAVEKIKERAAWSAAPSSEEDGKNA